jgi:hypothetical protein
MTNEPATARRLAEIAAAILAADDMPAPDFLDDRDVAAMFIVSAAVGLAELLDVRDDLGDGLLSGRYQLVVDRTGTALMEREVTV